MIFFCPYRLVNIELTFQSLMGIIIFTYRCRKRTNKQKTIPPSVSYMTTDLRSNHEEIWF